MGRAGREGQARWNHYTSHEFDEMGDTESLFIGCVRERSEEAGGEKKRRWEGDGGT